MNEVLIEQQSPRIATNQMCAYYDNENAWITYAFALNDGNEEDKL